MPALLETISAAVTPVVMVSAAAVLTLGVSNKHQAMSDRLRALAAEMRSMETTRDRRATIERQMTLFRRRIAFSAVAHRLLYVSIMLFMIMVLQLFFAPDRGGVGFGLFTAGVAAIIGAIGCELAELSLANRTLDLEMTSSK